MAKHSITRRWAVNSLGVIVVVLSALVIAFAAAIQSYYYSSARQYISSRLATFSGTLTKFAQQENINFSSEVRNVVESFSEKDKMELMVIDADGNVALTSSGFTPREKIAIVDYSEAISSKNGTGYYVGKVAGGERIMAVCVVLSDVSSDYEALRMVISLDEIDKQIASYVLSAAAVGAVIILFMFFSGMYFVKSIVIPVRQIGTSARRFATGDFSARITKKNDDEIGELCDIVNYMADELSNSEALKNEFISSVSHELRTPLTAIKGWAETLQQVDDPETMQKGMRVISSESERLSQMVEELLDFSRMQNGKLSLQKEQMDILAELGEAVLIYEERARQLGIQLLYNEPESLPFVYGDRNRMRQVFINIIDNAIKYSKSGGFISVEAVEAGGNKILITIADTGVGISEKDLPRIKTKFFKANNTVKGSGIGLAVANEIITMHGGSIDVISELGVGTTVEITIPAMPAKSKRSEEE